MAIEESLGNVAKESHPKHCSQEILLDLHMKIMEKEVLVLEEIEKKLRCNKKKQVIGTLISIMK